MRGGLAVVCAALAGVMGCGQNGPQSGLPGSRQVFNDQGTIYALGETEPYNGPVIDYHPNGKKSYEYTVKNGKPEGKVTEWHANGNPKTESMLKDGVLVGTMTGWYENGKKEYEMPLEAGEIHGQGKEYYPGGQVKSHTPYAKGEREGRETGFDESGVKLWEAEWKANRLDGEFVEFYPTGAKRMRKPYVKGVNKGKVVGWHINGEKASEGEWNGDKPVGTHFEWFANKELRSQRTYSGGLIIRIAEWHGNGRKAREISYSNGRPTMQKQWNADGKLIVATGEAALPPELAEKPKDPKVPVAKPNPNSAGRRMRWASAQLEAYCKGKTTEFMLTHFGEPDTRLSNTWVYSKMFIVDAATRRQLTTANLVINDGKVLSVQCAP